MKGKLSKRIEQIEDRYDKFRNMANVCPRILQENDDLKHEVNILHIDGIFDSLNNCGFPSGPHGGPNNQIPK
jgi:hypothetical protein